MSVEHALHYTISAVESHGTAAIGGTYAHNKVLFNHGQGASINVYNVTDGTLAVTGSFRNNTANEACMHTQGCWREAHCADGPQTCATKKTGEGAVGRRSKPRKGQGLFPIGACMTAAARRSGGPTLCGCRRAGWTSGRSTRARG
jgi:hypothetical protein